MLRGAASRVGFLALRLRWAVIPLTAVGGGGLLVDDTGWHPIPLGNPGSATELLTNL